MVFGQKLKISNPAKKDTIESASQEEQNGTILFSLIAPSSEELRVWKENALPLSAESCMILGQKSWVNL